MDYSKTAAAVLKNVGGEANVQSLVHCATRLRFVIRDESKIDKAGMKATLGVIATAEAGGQFQVVIGNEVPEVFAEISKISSLAGDTTSEGGATDAPKGNLLNRFIAMISAIFTPLLWALAGTGLLKAFLAAAVTFGWLDSTTSTFTILNALSDALHSYLVLVDMGRDQLRLIRDLRDEDGFWLADEHCRGLSWRAGRWYSPSTPVTALTTPAKSSHESTLCRKAAQAGFLPGCSRRASWAMRRRGCRWRSSVRRMSRCWPR